MPSLPPTPLSRPRGVQCVADQTISPRRQIIAIMSNPSLSAAEKAKAMQDLMTSEWRAKFDSPTPSTPATAVTDEDRKPCYHVAPSGDKPGILGTHGHSSTLHSHVHARPFLA